MRIDSMVFSHLLELERSKNMFGGSKDPTVNSYKPNEKILSKTSKPTFGIGEIKNTNVFFLSEQTPIFILVILYLK